MQERIAITISFILRVFMGTSVVTKISLWTQMESISEEVRQNTIFIFTSDHGEYGSSHGLQGKGGTVYDEGIRVPLIVRFKTQ